MPVFPILVLAALAAAPQASVTRYTLETVVDPKAHRIVIDGTYRDGSGKPKPILTVRTIHNPISRKGEDYSRGFAVSQGTIQSEGVYLGGSSKWYPAPADGGLLVFDLTVTLPPGWDAMSQGRREVLERNAKRTRVRFVADDPQEEIWLVAGPWTETMLSNSSYSSEKLKLIASSNPNPLKVRLKLLSFISLGWYSPEDAEGGNSEAILS